ncbi:c-type cytochrome [Bradyrhizobium sp.]|jgi:cytochrome c553|uniref:c-type cytochrome n=1 Tax=Bradyrhizobium sp. TaxID=376 RepID=UPI003C177644
MMINRFFSASAAIAIVGVGLASGAAAQAQANPPAPNPQRGAEIAAQGTPAGAPGCAQCHAFNGASDGTGAFPRVAGQSAYYLAKQLRDFASGVRDNAVMSPVAKAMTPADIADVAAYYAGVQAPFLPLPKPDIALVKQGEQIAAVGNEGRSVQACNNCHGPGGAGEPPAIPYLAGQYAPYIALELRMWQRGFRRSSANEMAFVSKQITDQEMAAVAAYYQQIRASGELANSQ